jgi:uncharacterized membrane protein (DUF2068 family)
MRNPDGEEQAGRGALRLAALLLCGGVVVTAIAGFLHPEGADPNDHEAIFGIYAASRSWTAVHLGQFAGMVVLTFGLLALYRVLDADDGRPWLNRLALLAAGVALAVYAVLQAVDGVGLKQATDAWAAAAGTDKAVRFDVAEAIRWLEWAVRSYHSYAFGLALILFGAAVARRRARGGVPRPVGYLMALSGICYLVQGWIIGATGFSPANQLPTLAGIVLVVAWAIWLLIATLRANGVPVTTGPRPSSRTGPHGA